MLGNLILETTNAPGNAADCLLLGPVSGRLPFSFWFSSGAQCFYVLNDGTQQEWGIGTFITGSPNVLNRTTVIKNSVGSTARLNFLGSTRVYNDIPAERSLWVDNNGNVNFPASLNVTGIYVSNAAGGAVGISDSDAPLDQKIFDFTSQSGVLYGRTVNDGYNAANSWLTVTRTGYVIGTVTLAGTQINLNAPVGVNGAMACHNTFTIYGDAGQASNIWLSPATGQAGQIITTRGAFIHWNIQPGDGTAADDFHIHRYDDAGHYVDAPLTISRATAAVTLTGAMTVPGNLSLGGSLWANGVVQQRSSGTVGYSELDGGNTTNTGYLGVYSAAGTRRAYLGYADATTLNINVDAPLTTINLGAATVGATNINAAARVTANDMMNATGVFYIGGNTAYYMARSASDSNWRWVENNGPANFIIAPNGDVSARASVFGTYMQSSGAVWAGTSMRVFGVGTNWSYWGNTTNYIGWSYNSTNLDVYVDYNFIGTAPSDERLKNIIGPYERGLAELRKIDPVLYRLKGNDRGVVPHDQPDAAAAQKELNEKPSIRDTNKVHVGFVAQKVEGGFPELVKRRPAVIDGERVDDVRYVDDGPWLTFAVVNAIKEMDARLTALTEANTALTARVAALEAKGTTA
jgi:Chaperone of endosialidase